MSDLSYLDSFNRIINETRTIQHFSTQLVEREKILVALSHSLMAPNHKLTFPWKYLWTGPQTRLKILEISKKNLRVKN